MFEGLITVANPKKSWVAKWQRLDTYVPGVYATKVSGSIPEDIRNGLIEDGHVLIPYVIFVFILPKFVSIHLLTDCPMATGAMAAALMWIRDPMLSSSRRHPHPHPANSCERT